MLSFLLFSQASLCYNGQDFGLVEEDTIVQMAGNQIVLWNATTGLKDYIECPRATGFSTFATNQARDLVAVAEYGLQPKCHIFQFPGKKFVAQFQMDTTLKAQAMAFSRDGKFLVIIGGLPDFKISIYDVLAQKLVSMSETKVLCKEEVRNVSFNPKTKHEFCILSESCIYFYKMLPAFKVNEAQDVDHQSENVPQSELVDAFRLEVSEFSVAEIPVGPEHQGNVIMTSLKWDLYGRVTLCTNTDKIFQVTSVNPQVEQTLDLQSTPMTTVLTQKHMIIAQEDGMINWFKIDMPSWEESALDQNIKLETEIEKDYNFAAQLGEQASDPAQYMYYSKSYKKLIIGTSNGHLAILNIEAEKQDFGDDEEDQENEKHKQTIQKNLQILGRFHVDKICGIRELGVSTQIVTISQDETIAIWETTTGKQLANIEFISQPISLDVSLDGKAVFVGSSLGVFRAYDVSNRSHPRLVKQFKFYDDEVPCSGIICSPDGKFVVVTSQKSNKVFFMSQKASQNFEIFGFAYTNGHVLSCALTRNSEDEVYALCVLNNSIAQVLLCPTKIAKDRMKPLSEDETKAMIRKLDQKTEIVIATANNNKAWFVAGQDYYLKKYTVFPLDQYHRISWNVAPTQPNFLLDSHSLETTSYYFSKEHDLLLTGGKDGKVIVRNVQDVMGSKLQQQEIVAEIQTHSFLSGGVTAVCASKIGQFIYSAGEDGSIFVKSLKSNQQYPKSPVEDSSEGTNEISKCPTVQMMNFDEIKNIMTLIEEEANKANEEKKRQFKTEIMDELEIIQRKLKEMLYGNEQVTDIEKLERDEFVVDVSRQEKFIADGEQVCNEIRQEAEKTTLRLQLLRERVKKSTWDTMDVQSKACKSILGEKLLYNFSIRKRRPEEERIYKQVVIQRKIELMDKFARLEKGVSEALKETDFSQEQSEEYFMNRIRGKPLFIDDDAIALIQKLLDQQRADKEKIRLAKMNNMNQNQQEGSGKQKPILTITKGRLGSKTKKSDNDEAARLAAKNNVQAIEIKGMEEIHWKVSFIKLFNKMGEDLKKTFENLNPYDILYDSFDLYTNKRKRTQIEIIKAVVFELRRDFNKEFEALEVKKEDAKLAIKEKNEIIRDLLHNLKESDKDVEEVGSHILENPGLILEIDEKEVPGVKYLTKEERVIKEEEERKIREREEALKGDNVQQRGLKTMMGGNELNLKKDKNQLENPYELREEWMNKPQDQMSEDEKSRLKDWELKKKDFEDKQNKSWRQTLQIHKGDVLEIKYKFEEELLCLYKKRLFYEARIYEQELYIIRLIIMLSDIQETNSNIGKFRNDFEKLNEQFQEKLIFYQQVIEKQGEFAQKIKTENGIPMQEIEVKKWALEQQLRPQMILDFVRKGKPQAKQILSDVQKAELLKEIVQLDPFSPIDKTEIEAEINLAQQKEVYVYENPAHTPGDVDKEQFEHIVEQRQLRIDLNKIVEDNNKRLNTFSDFSAFLEKSKTELQNKVQELDKNNVKVIERQEKLKFNFEVIVYMRQGQVEVPQLPVATDYKDAILVQKQDILQENSEIRSRGMQKIREMTNILKNKTDLKQIELEDKKLLLQITDFRERAKDVQLYRVTKQTQEIIQGKHHKRDEEDKKRLENQLKQLEENTGKRIAAINQTKNKLKREIREKKTENEQLEAKARVLKLQVEQRGSIILLRSKDQADDSSDPQKKCAEISQQRKLIEVIQQQSEEMMFLKDELDRLRARTFPSFAHLQKPEYPDERQ